MMFRTSAERNLHIIQHFNQIDCSVCSENLIEIGNAWYGQHKHSVCNVTHSETDIVEPKQEKPFDGYQTENSLDENGSKNYATTFDKSMEMADVLSSESLFIEHKPLHIFDAPPEGYTNNLIEAANETTQNIDKSQGKPKVDVCPVCNKHIKCKTTFKYHLNICNGVKPYECGSCNKAYADKRKLVQHLKKFQHKIKEAIVPDDARAKTISGQKINDQTNDPISSKAVDALVTSVDTQSEQNSTLKVERKSVTGGTCTICNKQFSCRTGLKYHMNIHLGIQPYKCDECDKSFHDKRNMIQHKKKHTLKDDETNKRISQLLISATEDVNIVLQSSNNIDWMCEYCNGDFELEIRLAKHVIKEHGDNRESHVCNICGEKFGNPNDLLVHMRNHPESKQFVCGFLGCGQGFAFKSSLGVHTNKHSRLNKPIERRTQDQLTEIAKQHATLLISKEDKTTSEEISFKCSGCVKQFDDRTKLLAHIQAVHKRKWEKCTECDRIFKSDVSINRHMQIEHPNAMQTCDLCEKSFISKDKLEKHKQTHEMKEKVHFECSFCNETFSNKYYLRFHLTTHEKDAACNICGEKFNSARQMLIHRERHSKKQVIRCRFNDCNQVFEDRRALLLHSTEHPSELRRKYICSICGKSIASRSYYRDHMNSHTGATPYECSYCGKKFGKSGSLYRHKLIHTGKMN